MKCVPSYLRQFVCCSASLFGLWLCLSPASALQRTFVSSSGNNTNPCTRTQPCRTFQAAIAALDVGGEVIALDSGGYGAVTVDKSLTLTGGGAFAGISATTGNAIQIAGSVSDRITLRGLNVNGLSNSQSGLVNTVGGTVYVENCLFNGFNFQGINWNAPGELYLHDTSVRNCGGGGIALTSSTGSVFGLLEHVTVADSGLNADGVAVWSGANASVAVRDSTAAGSPFGFLSSPGQGSPFPSKMTVWNSLATKNTIGIFADYGAVITVSHSKSVFNGTGVGSAHGGTVQGDSPDELSFNATDGTFNLIVTNGVPQGSQILGPSTVAPDGFTFTGDSVTATSTDAWKLIGNLNVGRDGISAAVLGGLIYAIAGSGNSGSSTTVETYDPATDAWTLKTGTLNSDRRQADAVVLNNQLYVIGGSGTGGVYNTVELYNAGADTWSVNAHTLNVHRTGAGGVALNGKIYVMGGINDAFTNVGSVEEYNSATDTWTTETHSMNTPRSAFATAVVGGKIYVLGGSGSSGILTSIEEYEPGTDTWTTKAGHLVVPREEVGSAAASNGKIYVFGGQDGLGNNFDTVEEYDPVTDTCILTDGRMNTPRDSPGSVELNGKIYAIGGYNAIELPTNEAYTPPKRYYVHQKN